MNFITTRYAEAILANAADLIEYGIEGCDLGKVLVARSKTGVCAISLGANQDEMEQSLAATFPASLLVHNKAHVRDELAKVVQFIASPKGDLDFELDVRGTPFQHRVWDALRTVESGRPVTYAQLACRMHGPKSLPAIAQACSENPIAIAIPCHRVMGNSGSTFGSWGRGAQASAGESRTRPSLVEVERSAITSPARPAPLNIKIRKPIFDGGVAAMPDLRNRCCLSS